MEMTSHGQCPRGGGVLVNVQEWGRFSIFRRAGDVTRTMSKGGGGACECLHPPPFSGNPHDPLRPERTLRVTLDLQTGAAQKVEHCSL